jgi:hypothetical protein
MNEMTVLASKNIITQLNIENERKVILVNSNNKNRLASGLISEFKNRHISFIQFKLNSAQDSLKKLVFLINDKSSERYFIFLIDPSDADFLFENVGRPDMGLKIPEKYLFCDWLMPEDQFVRLNSINLQENKNYQRELRSSLNTVDTIYITTEAGTNISLKARNWIIDKGEIYCTPLEGMTNGVIIIDGCAYWGPPVKPIKLNIVSGKVTNIDSLSKLDKQEKIINQDFTRDENASILSEFGIGTNKNALWNNDIMESEQSRGTCHFGFGMNLNYGGEIKSEIHFDLVVLNPTISINRNLIYEKGIIRTK